MIEKHEIEQARNTDMVEFLERHKGYKFKQISNNYRVKQHPSFAIASDRLAWYWHSQGIGGYGAIDYLMKIDNYEFKDAISTLSRVSIPIQNYQPIYIDKPKELILPPKSTSLQRVYYYLCELRCLSENIIRELVKQNMIYQDKNSNVVFVGYDTENQSKFACVRGTSLTSDYRVDCKGSDKKYSFNISNADAEKLYVFESPIDLISHATLENLIQKDNQAYTKQSRLSLGGTSDKALEEYLRNHKNIQEIIFCLDNDDVGRNISVDLSRKYDKYITSIELPINKDYNEDLIKFKKK